MRSAILAVALMCFAFQSRAASQDECAIWLCLPTGFMVPGCQPAFKAMMKRKYEFKSPVPSFGKCSIDGKTNGMSYDVFEASLHVKNDVVRIGPTRCPAENEDPIDSSRRPEPTCLVSFRGFAVYQNGEQMGNSYLHAEFGPDMTYHPETGELTILWDDGTTELYSNYRERKRLEEIERQRLIDEGVKAPGQWQEN